jgi:hypothetical protein
MEECKRIDLSGHGLLTGSFEHGNEPSSSINDEEFLESLSNSWFLKKASAPWSQFVVLSDAIVESNIKWADELEKNLGGGGDGVFQVNIPTFTWRA